MIERKVVVDQIEIRRDGTTGVRVAVLLVEDDKEIDCKWHRTVIDGTATVQQQMDEVNRHLEFMGLPVVGQDEIDKIAEYDEVDRVAKMAKRQERVQIAE